MQEKNNNNLNWYEEALKLIKTFYSLNPMI